MQNQAQTDTSSLLAEILMQPSEKTTTDRFTAENAAPCSGECSGECHGSL